MTVGAMHNSSPGRWAPEYAGSLLQAEAAPGDALGRLLVMLEASGQSTLEQSQTQIAATREDIREQLDDFMEKMAAAFREAKKKDDGGFFGDVFDAVTDFVGDLVGTVVEFNVEVITSQLDLAVSLAKSVRDGQNLLDTVGASALKLAENGQISQDVKGASVGVTRFAADAIAFGVKLHVNAARAALTGENMGDLVEKDAATLAASLEANIIDNPQLWAVAGATLRGAAVLAAVGSGGTLAAPAVAALCLVAVLEADARYDVLEETVGKEAAPKVRLAIGIAASICLAASPAATGNAADIAKKIRAACSIAQGAATAYSGVRRLAEANREADALDLLADQKQSLNRLHSLQRLLTELLGDLEEHAESQTRTRQASANVVATAAATEAALIIPA